MLKLTLSGDGCDTETNAKAAAIMQAQARGERDRKAVQVRRREGSLPGQQRQSEAGRSEAVLPEAAASAARGTALNAEQRVHIIIAIGQDGQMPRSSVEIKPAAEAPGVPKVEAEAEPTDDPSWVAKLGRCLDSPTVTEVDLDGAAALLQGAASTVANRPTGGGEAKAAAEAPASDAEEAATEAAMEATALEAQDAAAKEAVKEAVERAVQMAVDMSVKTSWVADAMAASITAAEAEASPSGSTGADAQAAAIMQARVRGERDRKAVQARRSLLQQEEQLQLQQEADEKVAVVRADIQQLKDAQRLGSSAQQILSPRVEQLLSPNGMRWVQQHMQTRCCGSRGKMPKKPPRLPLPGAEGGVGLFGTPILSSLMLEYGDWIHRYS